MADDFPAFAVWHRGTQGVLEYQYQANHPFYEVVERCILICHKMLQHPKTQRAFVALGEELEKVRPGALVSHEMNSTDTRNMEKKTKDFFGSIFTRFPAVIVDYTMREPDFMAYHKRRALNTAFDTRVQWISVNGQRVGHMVAARTKADTTANNRLNFHQFLFLYSSTLLHELAHAYITYLGLGRSNTPEEINEGILEGIVSGDEAEAGGWLEKTLFGGVVNEYREPVVGTEDKKSGVPFLCTSGGPYRIDQETIDEVVSGKERELVTMASNYNGPKTDLENDTNAIVAKLSTQSVRPPPNINIDDLWDPAPRS